jgi:HlyD family secretion protein
MHSMSRRQPQGLAFLSEDRPVEAFEQLDRMLQVISPRRWVYLAVVFLSLVAFGVFSCFYRAPLKVDGRGIILARQSGERDSLFQVTAPASGRLKKVGIKIGSILEKGQIIGEIDQSDLEDQIRETKAELARLLREDEELTQLDVTESAWRAQSWKELEQTLHHNMELDQGRLINSRKIAAADRSLNTRRMLSDSDALKSRSEADSIESSIGSKRVDLEELNYQRILDQFTRRRDKLKRALAIQATRIKLELATLRLDRDTQIISAYAGRVVDLMITPHAMVEKGAPAALLQPLDRGDQPLEARLFVPAGMGKRIRVGDPVEVSPDTTRRHEHGYVRGVVQSVSEIPASEMAMLADLKHKTLVTSFLEQHAGQVLLSIRVALPERSLAEEARETVANRLDWSSRTGRRESITTGTLCSASIVVETRPLITLALPWARQLFGAF